MSDLKESITKELKNLQLASLATLTDTGVPWARYVMIQGDDELVVRCATFVGSRKVAQIRNNPEVHITCGITDPAQMKPYLQIQGRAEIVEDEVERHAFWNPALDSIFSGADDPGYAVVVVKPYRIEYCTPPNMEPEVLDLS